MRYHWSLFFLLFAICCFCSDGLAQLYFSSKTLTDENGLSDNRITCFYKDKTGFLWIGTKNGLNQYNGHAFTVYKPAPKNAVSSEIITDIVGDTAGNIWVATMNGLNKYEPATGKWKVWLPNMPDTKRDLPNSLIWDIAFDKKGLLWVASDVFEFASFDVAANSFSYYDWPSFVKTIRGKKTTPGYHSIQRFVQKDEDEFWLGTNKGLVHLNTATKTFTYIGGGYNDDVLDIQWDAERQEVLLSVKGGLFFIYNAIRQQYQSIQTTEDSYPSTILPKENDGYQRLIPASDGLLYRMKGSNQFFKMKHITGLKTSLPSGAVATVYHDSAGLYWVGTTHGIFIEDQGAMNIAFLPLMPANPSESVSQMSSVCYSEADSMYFVTAVKPAAFFTIDNRNGRIKKYTHDNKGRLLSACLMAKQTGKDIWLLTERFVYKYNPKTALLDHVATPYDGEKVGFRDIAVDGEGNTWWATFYKGIFYYDQQLMQFQKVKGERANYLNDVATALHIDTVTKKLWMGSYGRYVHAYDFAQKKLTGYDELNGVSRYQYLNLIHDITADAAGNMWVATNTGGIFKHNRGVNYQQAFTQFNMQSGMGSNQYVSLVAGKKSMLWLLSGSGISWINTNEKEPVEKRIQHVFGFSNDVADPTVPHRIFYRQATDELLVPAANGMLFYHPFRNTVIAPFPLLVSVRYAGSDSSNLTNFSNELQLTYQQNTLHFDFAGLYYGMASITYRYMLEGYDEQWQVAGNENMGATYKNLPDKNYQLRFQALDQYGNLIVESKPIAINISPPFWLHWWFVLTAISICIVAFYLLIKKIEQRFADEKMLNNFATALYGKNNIDEISWQVAQHCVIHLGFTHCDIYQLDASKKVLVQVATAGSKSDDGFAKIFNPIEVSLGDGVVGAAAKNCSPFRVSGNAAESMPAEIAMPIQIDGKVFGVIHSKHASKGFFTKRHVRLLKRIAEFMAARVAKYLTEEKIRSNIARDLHDEMGSTLTSINILSKVAMSQNRPQAEIQQHLQKIKDHSSNMMESMSDMVWAINPANDNMDKMAVHMREFAAEILEPAGISFYMDIRGPVSTVTLNIQERKDLYLIFKEAVNNAVKYSAATEINITLQRLDDALLLRITDNGNGFVVNDCKHGNGLKNMQVRADAMGALLSIESIVGTGTAISIRKPLT